MFDCVCCRLMDNGMEARQTMGFNIEQVDNDRLWSNLPEAERPGQRRPSNWPRASRNGRNDVSYRRPCTTNFQAKPPPTALADDQRKHPLPATILPAIMSQNKDTRICAVRAEFTNLYAGQCW